MIRLDKLVCSHCSLGAFTAYTKDYQQLQMRLGDFDSRSTAQRVRQYMKGLPDNVKQIIVTHQVTHLVAYMFLTTGQHLDLFLRLGQKYLAAVTDAQPTGAGIATGMRPGRVNTKLTRYAKPASVGRFSQAPVRHSAAARAPPKDYQGQVYVPDDATSDTFKYVAYRDSGDPRPFSTDLQRQLADNKLCFFCWLPGHPFKECPDIQAKNKRDILRRGRVLHTKQEPHGACMQMTIAEPRSKKSKFTGANAVPLGPAVAAVALEGGPLGGSQADVAVAAPVAAPPVLAAQEPPPTRHPSSQERSLDFPYRPGSLSPQPMQIPDVKGLTFLDPLCARADCSTQDLDMQLTAVPPIMACAHSTGAAQKDILTAGSPESTALLSIVEQSGYVAIEKNFSGKANEGRHYFLPVELKQLALETRMFTRHVTVMALQILRLTAILFVTVMLASYQISHTNALTNEVIMAGLTHQ